METVSTLVSARVMLGTSVSHHILCLLGCLLMLCTFHDASMMSRTIIVGIILLTIVIRPIIVIRILTVMRVIQIIRIVKFRDAMIRGDVNSKFLSLLQCCPHYLQCPRRRILDSKPKPRTPNNPSVNLIVHFFCI